MDAVLFLPENPQELRFLSANPFMAQYLQSAKSCILGLTLVVEYARYVSMKIFEKLRVLVLAGLILPSANAKDIYFAQNAIGTASGLDAANANSLAALNSWANVVAGDTIHLVGVLT